MDIALGTQYDMHAVGTWGYLCHLARSGHVVAVVGGPPCRSVSRLRHREPGPRPLRGRDERRFGLDGLSAVEQDLAYGDLALVLKQFGLWLMAEEARVCSGEGPGHRSISPAYLMESPRDPVTYMKEEALQEDMPSFWNFREVRDMMEVMNAKLITLDQGPVGHVKRKPTSLMVVNMPDMDELDGMTGDVTGQQAATTLRGRLCQSREWSAWAPGLVAAIKLSLKRYLGRLHSSSNHGSDGRPALQRMDMEAWKDHVRNQHQPYRRDCRRCMEMMGMDAPHRRTRGDRAAYCLSYDIVGPMPEGEDVGLGTRAKYLLVATVAIPRLPREDPDDGEARELDGEDGDPLPIGEDEDERPVPDDEQVQRLNKAWEDYIKSLGEPVGVQNITLVEPLESRSQMDVTKVATRIFCRFKAMGVNMLRVHTDRECAFLSRSFQAFCRRFGLYQTMMGGDEGPSNGRIECEVNQVKRRLRLLIKESGLEQKWWLGIARYVGEERLRRQCSGLGVPSTALLPIGGRVTVKTKRWHRAGFGPLTAPFRTMTIMGPSPFMSQGYVLMEGEQIQHARVVVQQDPGAERAVLELQMVPDPERPQHRLTGKQPMEPMLPQLPPPRSSPDPGLHRLHATSGGEPVQVWTGGESLYAVCKECGLQCADGGSMKKMEGRECCDFCETPLERLEEKAVNGTMECGVEEAHNLTRWMHEEHWGWKQLWSDLLKDVVVGEEDGLLRGALMDYLEKNVLALENELTEIRDFDLGYQMAKMAEGVVGECPDGEQQSPLSVHAVLQTYTVPLAQVKKELKDWIPSLEYEVNSLERTTKAVRPVSVRDLCHEPGYEEMLVVPSKLVPTVKAPDGKKRSRIVLCGNLVEDTARRTGHSQAVKEDKQVNPSAGRSFELYASGIDGGSLRCALRKAAYEQWSIGITDVSSAFLLAPRKSPRLMVTKPPAILIEAGLISADTRWVVEAAVYGLDSSPSDWQAYRDDVLRSLRWWESGVHYWINATPEPNVWRLMTANGAEGDYVNVMEEGETSGFALSYVDDFIVMGPQSVAQTVLTKLASTWRCSTPTWVVSSEWRKFCGVEMKWNGANLMIGQPDYARELVTRHPDLPLRYSPLPKMIELEPEEVIDPTDVKQCQTLVGELLWLSTRTRPDLSFAVAYLGAKVTKSPKGVLELASHVVGYLAATPDLVLEYGPCSPELDRHGRKQSLARLEVLTDSSFAPAGGRGHQGIMAMWGGCLVAWESKSQAFATLSTTESELLGYIDGFTLGESVGAVVNVLHQNILEKEGAFTLKGDNMSGLQLLQAPSGPWRTRHLRLRSHVLRERLQHHLWDVEHVPGTELCADLLTKSITQSQSWLAFRNAVGLRDAASLGQSQQQGDGDGAAVKKVAYAAMASLGLLAAMPYVGSLPRIACVTALGAIATFVASSVYQTAGCQSTKRPNATQKRTDSRWSRENEPDPSRWTEKSRWSRENEPGPTSTDDRSLDTCHLGTLSDTSHAQPWIPRLRAIRALGPHLGLGTDTPWRLERFATPPTGNDRWECLGSGDGAGEWWVRVLKKSRVRAFHPLHRGTPFMIERMASTRVTVAFHRSSTREAWKRKEIMDDWINSRNSDLADVYEWRGYSFFYVRFPPRETEGHVGSASSNPLPPPGSVTQGPHGYGEDQPSRSRAVERGRAALAEAGCRSYAAVEASAEGALGHASEESQGYRVRLQGYEKRGETGTIEGSWTRALAGEGLIEEDPSQMPVWLGIETAVTGGNREPEDTDSSHSRGSFEKV